MKEIPGFEGLYSATEDGRIYSHLTGIFLKAFVQTSYLSVALRKTGNYYQHTVHSLVARTFLGSRTRGLEVDHINRKKLDNRACNLRYVTRGFNVHHEDCRKRGPSGFKGIYLLRRPYGSYWVARIKLNGKNKSLGCHKTPREAALAYDAALVDAYGGMALTNRAMGLL